MAVFRAWGREVWHYQEAVAVLHLVVLPSLKMNGGTGLPGIPMRGTHFQLFLGQILSYLALLCLEPFWLKSQVPVQGQRAVGPSWHHTASAPPALRPCACSCQVLLGTCTWLPGAVFQIWMVNFTYFDGTSEIPAYMG